MAGGSSLHGIHVPRERLEFTRNLYKLDEDGSILNVTVTISILRHRFLDLLSHMYRSRGVCLASLSLLA